MPPIIKKPYPERVYDALKENVKGFNTTPEQFKEDLKNPELQKKIYKNLKQDVVGFTLPEDEFYKRMTPVEEPGVLKKALDFVVDTGVSSYKSAVSTFADQVPSEFYTEDLRLSKGSMEDMLLQGANIHSSGFESKVTGGLRTKYEQWNNLQPYEIRVNKTDKQKAEMFLKNEFGPQYNEKKKAFDAELSAYRTGIEQKIAKQKSEAATSMEGAPQSLAEVTSENAGKFVGNLVGQMVGRIPSSILSGGASSFIAERAAVYDEQIDLIAKKTGLTREEVVQKALDDPEAGRVLADLLGVTEIASLGNLMAGGGKKILKKAVDIVLEGAQETIQGEGEAYGASVGAKTKYTPDANRMGTGFAGGVLGGGAVSLGATALSKGAKVVGLGGENKVVAPEGDLPTAPGVSGDVNISKNPVATPNKKTKIYTTGLKDTATGKDIYVREIKVAGKTTFSSEDGTIKGHSAENVAIQIQDKNSPVPTPYQMDRADKHIAKSNYDKQSFSEAYTKELGFPESKAKRMGATDYSLFEGTVKNEGISNEKALAMVRSGEARKLVDSLLGVEEKPKATGKKVTESTKTKTEKGSKSTTKVTTPEGEKVTKKETVGNKTVTKTVETPKSEAKPAPQSKAKPSPVVTEQKAEEVKPVPVPRDVFKGAVDLHYKIVDAQKSKKPAQVKDLKKQRDSFLKDHPKVKYIHDNIKSITKQLEDKGALTKKGDCL